MGVLFKVFKILNKLWKFMGVLFALFYGLTGRVSMEVWINRVGVHGSLWWVSMEVSSHIYDEILCIAAPQGSRHTNI